MTGRPSAEGLLPCQGCAGEQPRTQQARFRGDLPPAKGRGKLASHQDARVVKCGGDCQVPGHGDCGEVGGSQAGAAREVPGSHQYVDALLCCGCQLLDCDAGSGTEQERNSEAAVA